jgi:hypothetical protein
VKKAILSELSVYVVAIGLVSLLWRNPLVLTGCYIGMSILVLYRWHTRSDLFFYCVAFVLGPTAEAVAVHSGAWEYSEPSFLIPLWLPLAWGIAVVFIKRFSETLLGEHP